MLSRIWTYVWRKFLAPIGLSITLSFGFLALHFIPVLNTWINIVADPTPDWYIKLYYNTVNDITATPDTFPGIVILDLKESITREGLADLMQLTAKSSPKVVGIDCTFSTSDSYDSKQTDSLINTIAHFDSLPSFVFAVVSNETSVIPDSIIRYKGFVDAEEYNHYTTYKDGIPHFALEMARLAGYNIHRLDSSSFLVNYRTKAFESIQIYSDFKEYGAEIQEKIAKKNVLIGRFNDRLDMHYVPFQIDPGVDMISGTKIIAYSLSSIISASNPNNCKDRTFHHYSRCSWWMNLLLTFFFTIIYLCIYMLIAYAQQKSRWLELLKPLLLFFMLALIIGSSMVYTAKCFYVPYIGFFIIITTFLGFAYDIFNPPFATLENKSRAVTRKSKKRQKHIGNFNIKH